MQFQIFNREITIILLILFAPIAIHAQVSDDFSDGDLTSDPAWSGDTSHFSISNSSAIPAAMKPALQLDHEGADTSILVLPSNLVSGTEWHFWAKQSFNSSANNFARIYLASDQEDLKNPLNGYFIQLGGANDSLGLFKQTGLETDTLIVGDNIFFGNSTNAVRVKVVHTLEGLWKLYADQEGGYNLELEGSTQDTDVSTADWFGLFCKYTSSNATKFYFDDFLVQPITIDTLPPEIAGVEVIDQHQLDILFSEAVEPNSAALASNYLVNNQIGEPDTVFLDPDNQNKVKLFFEESFSQGIGYTLQASGITDLNGNLMEIDSVAFEYYPFQNVAPYTILISELMADINPVPQALPEAEYLELYNSMNDSVFLGGCTLQTTLSNDPLELPDVYIPADSFLILTNSTNVENFVPFGRAATVSGFTLNNESVVVLRNAEGVVVHALAYDESWYQDEEKATGGWSLEMIDLNKPCGGAVNWKASWDEAGGTPGQTNSVNGLSWSEPELIKIWVSNEQTLEVEFSETMDSLELATTTSWEVAGMGHPVAALVSTPIANQLQLVFEQSFTENELLQLVLVDTLWNCAGQFIPPGSSYEFVQPLVADPFDVVINEIMPDPEPSIGLPPYEFIEVFNTTDNYLRMEGWTLQIGTTQKQIPDLIINPKEYLIFCEDEADALFGMFGRTAVYSSLGITNSGVRISLYDEQDRLISTVNYNNDWYTDDQKSDGGWSLEQIDPYAPCLGVSNWTTSEDTQGGTPGSINSVDANNSSVAEIDNALVTGSNTLKIQFNQLMDQGLAQHPEFFSVDQLIGPAVIISAGDIYNQIFNLTFEKDFSTGVVYELSFDMPVTNCNGTITEAGYTFLFGKHEEAEKEDLVINEILCNPRGSGVEFVEIVNRSAKIIDLNGFQLGTVSYDIAGQPDTSFKQLTTTNKLMLMGEYHVLTQEPQKVMDQYFTSNPGGFLKMESFPTLPNSGGTIVLTNPSGRLLDHLVYNEEMHHPLISVTDGVSLERIDYDRPASDETNWHSAASEVGYATPAYQNSQYKSAETTADAVTLEPELFSPNNDGMDDILNINYNFGSSGYVGTIVIYDSGGRRVRLLINNQLFGSKGTFSWDGKSDDGQKAAAGIYVILVEAFNEKGDVKKYKKTAVLAERY